MSRLTLFLAILVCLAALTTQQSASSGSSAASSGSSDQVECENYSKEECDDLDVGKKHGCLYMGDKCTCFILNKGCKSAPPPPRCSKDNVKKEDCPLGQQCQYGLSDHSCTCQHPQSFCDALGTTPQSTVCSDAKTRDACRLEIGCVGMSIDGGPYSCSCLTPSEGCTDAKQEKKGDNSGNGKKHDGSKKTTITIIAVVISVVAVVAAGAAFYMIRKRRVGMGEKKPDLLAQMQQLEEPGDGV